MLICTQHFFKGSHETLINRKEMKKKKHRTGLKQWKVMLIDGWIDIVVMSCHMCVKSQDFIT